MSNHLACSFCGRLQIEAKVLIAGPAVYICEMCIETAYRILPDTEKILEERMREDGGNRCVAQVRLPSETDRHRIWSSAYGAAYARLSLDARSDGNEDLERLAEEARAIADNATRAYTATIRLNSPLELNDLGSETRSALDQVGIAAIEWAKAPRSRVARERVLALAKVLREREERLQALGARLWAAHQAREGAQGGDGGR